MSEQNPPEPGWSQEQPPPFVAGRPDQDPDRPAGWTPPPPAPKPGVVPLRPLTVGDIVSGAIDYVRRDPKAVIAIAAIVGVGAALLQLVLLAYTARSTVELPQGDPATIDPAILVRAFTGLIVIALVTAAISVVLQVFGTGMLTHVMGRAVIGRHTTVAEAWGLVRPQVWRLLGATVLVSLIVGAAVIIPLAPGIILVAMGSTESGAALLLVGMGAAFVLGVWLGVSFVLTTPTVALEDCGPGTALKRSWHLVRGAFWRTLGIVLLGSIVGQAVGAFAAAPFSLIGSASGDLTTVSVFALALGWMVNVLVALPFIAGVTALVYIDRRIRTEDLAPTLLTASQGVEPDARV